MKVRWFEHIVEQPSPWLLLLWTLALWPCQCSHPQLSWKTTNRLLVRVLWSRNPTPGTFLQPILCPVPAAPGSVRRCEPTRPTYPSFGFKGADPIRHTGHVAGNMSCWAQTGFPEVCKGTAGSVFSVSLKKKNRVEKKQEIWRRARGLLVLFAPLTAAELFEKVYLDANFKCSSESTHWYNCCASWDGSSSGLVWYSV